MRENLTGSGMTNITRFGLDSFNTTSLLEFGDLFVGPFTNNTNVEHDCLQAKQSSLLSSILCPIFIVGLVGNSMLILIFARQEKMRTAANTYIMSLAVMDLVSILGCAISPQLLYSKQAHPVYCKVFQFILDTSLAGTSYTLAALSAERYYAIANLFHRKASPKTFTLKVVIMIWVMSIIYVLGKLLLSPSSKCSKCITMFDVKNFASLCSVVDFYVLYLVPLGIIASYYGLMAHKLYFKDYAVLKGCATTNTAMCRRIQVRKKVAIAVLLIVAMFALGYLPYHVLQVKFYFAVMQGKHLHWASLVNTFFCIGCLHNSLSPLVLYSLSKSFRGHFNNYLFYNIFSSPVPVEEETTESAH